MEEESVKFEHDELGAWGHHVESHFLDVLNGDTSLEEARSNLASFRNSEYYTGSNERYSTLKAE